jgi:hypothetical protein
LQGASQGENPQAVLGGALQEGISQGLVGAALPVLQKTGLVSSSMLFGLTSSAQALASDLTQRYLNGQIQDPEAEWQRAKEAFVQGIIMDAGFKGAGLIAQLGRGGRPEVEPPPPQEQGLEQRVVQATSPEAFAAAETPVQAENGPKAPEVANTTPEAVSPPTEAPTAPPAVSEAEQGIPVTHMSASPEAFSEFSLDKAGTGEGAKIDNPENVRLSRLGVNVIEKPSEPVVPGEPETDLGRNLYGPLVATEDGQVHQVDATLNLKPEEILQREEPLTPEQVKAAGGLVKEGTTGQDLMDAVRRRVGGNVDAERRIYQKLGFKAMAQMAEENQGQTRKFVVFDPKDLKVEQHTFYDENGNVVKSAGPGAAEAGFNEPVTPFTTSIKNADVNAQREARGESKLLTAIRKSRPELHAQVLKAVEDDPGLGERIANEFARTDRPVNDLEQGVLAYYQNGLYNIRNAAIKMINEARAAGDEVGLAQGKVQLEDVNAKLDVVDHALHSAGTTAGRTLAYRQASHDERFNLVDMLREQEAVKGRPLTPEETAKVKALHASIKAGQDAADMEAERAAEAERQKAETAPFAAAKKRAAERQKASGKDESPADLEAERAALVARIAAAVTPEGRLQPARKWLRELEANLVRSGIDDPRVMYKTVHRLLEDALAKREGPPADHAGKESRAKSEAAQTPDAAAIQEARKLPVRKVMGDIPWAVEDALDAYRKTGSRDDAVHAYIKTSATLGEVYGGDRRAEETVNAWIEKYERKLRGEPEVKAAQASKGESPPIKLTVEEVRDALSGYGQYRPLDMEKTKVAMRDLNGQMQKLAQLQAIMQKEPIKKTGMERRTPSDAERRRIDMVNEAKRRYGVVVTDPASQLKSAEQAIATRLDHQIADLEHEIATGKRILPNKTKVADTPEIAAKRARVAELRAARDSLLGVEPKSLEQRLAAAKKAAERSRAEAEQRLADAKKGIFHVGEKTQGPKLSSNEIEAIRAEAEAMRKQTRLLYDLANPGKTPEERAITARMAQLENQRADLLRRLADNDFSRPERKPRPTTPAIEKLQAEVDGLRAKVDAAWKASDEGKAAALEMRLEAKQRQLSEWRRRIDEKDFTPRTREAPPENAKIAQANLEIAHAKREYYKMLAKFNYENSSPLEKVMSWILRTRRFSILTSPVVFGKLGAAAVARLGTQGVEDVVGSGINAALPAFGERTVNRSGIDLENNLPAYRSLVTKGLPDAWKMLTKGETPLTEQYGKSSMGSFGETKARPEGLPEMPGRLHGAMKMPIERWAWERSRAKWAAYYAKQGRDVNSPEVQAEIGQKAFQEAQRYIFMQDNWVATKFNSLLNNMARNKEGSTSQAVAAFLARWAFPIVKVPVNIAGETFEGVHGLYTGGYKLAKEYGVAPRMPEKGWLPEFKRTIESLPPEEADVIGRLLAKGLMGQALMVAGYFLDDKVGGFYRGKDTSKTQGKVKPGHVIVGGIDIPPWIAMHNPASILLQLGATVHQVQRKMGITSGIQKGIVGLLETLPFNRGMEDIKDIMGLGPKHAAYKVAGEQVVPTALPVIARWMDTDRQGNPVQRDPQSFGQGIAMQIPGLRESVPKKKKTGGAK